MAGVVGFRNSGPENVRRTVCVEQVSMYLGAASFFWWEVGGRTNLATSSSRRAHNSKHVIQHIHSRRTYSSRISRIALFSNETHPDDYHHVYIFILSMALGSFASVATRTSTEKDPRGKKSGTLSKFYSQNLQRTGP